jgi:hypothetical protein
MHGKDSYATHGRRRATAARGARVRAPDANVRRATDAERRHGWSVGMKALKGRTPWALPG